MDFGIMSSFDKRKEYYERLGLEEGATPGRLCDPLSSLSFTFCKWIAYSIAFAEL